MADAPPPPTESSDPSPTPADPLVGTVLAGRYRIVRQLGAGAMGSVYLGEHLRFGRLDAIKVLKAGVAAEPGAADRFLRGARNVSAINHPNVCTVYDFGDTDDGHQFLAMEFIDGVSLSDVLDAEGRLPLRRGLDITRQIGEALDAAHHMGIVHRDLKPGNVMLVTDRTGRDVVKVVDFDIAKGSSDGEEAEVTRTGFVVGTPEYMSPEQLTGDALDLRSDVYSLALLFVRMITGRLPVRSSTTQNLMVERLTQDALRISEIAADLVVPEGVQDAVDHGLQRRREDRPPSAGAFVAGLVRGARTGSGAAPSHAPGSPAAPAGVGAESVPATRVGEAPVGARVASGASSPLRRFAPLAVGALVVVAGGFGLVQWLGGSDDPGSATSTPAVGAPTSAQGPGEASSDGENDPSPDGPTEGGGATVTPSSGSGGADPERSEPPPPDPVTPPTTGTTPTTPPVTPAALTADGARALLARQEDLLLGDISAPTLAAVADSATRVWDTAELPGSVRAYAAFVLAQRYGMEDRATEALPWARRAVQLDPGDEGYRTFLELLGGRP